MTDQPPQHSSPENAEPIPLADHDEIGRKVLGQPWAIQSAVVTIAAHCRVLVDKHPTGEVADLAGCISHNCLELANALARHAQTTLERLPVEKLAKHFAVSVAQAQAAQDDIGFMYRELASPVTSTEPRCSHPHARLWMYRDDDTFMICPDCDAKWVEAPPAVTRPDGGGPALKHKESNNEKTKAKEA